MKRIVFRNFDFWMISFTSFIPILTALRETKGRSRYFPMSHPRLVFPTPEGPQKIMEGISFLSRRILRNLPSPRRCS